MLNDFPIGILVSSDRAAAGVYEDRGGPAIAAYLKVVMSTPWHAITRVVADEQTILEATLIELADRERCPLILTTGGTGPATRDVTPEATRAVCDRILDGFGEAMRRASLAEVPTAILSRQLAGTRKATLIVNLPGKPAAIAICLDAVFAAIPYCLDSIGGPRIETNSEVCQAFRPSS
jgi:molybdopterin adenylyltransferase